MIYSVWNPASQKYAYYEVSEAHADDVPTPACRGKTSLGCAPAELTWTLPAGARPMGEGDHARGVVVHPSGGGALSGFTDSPLSSLLLVGVGIIAWQALK